MSYQLFSICLPFNWNASHLSEILAILNGEGLLKTPIVKKNGALKHLCYWYKVISLNPQFKMGREKYICPLLCKPGLSTSKPYPAFRFSTPPLPHLSLSIMYHSNISGCRQWGSNWHKQDLARLAVRFEGYSSLLRMSTTSSFGLLGFVFFIGVLEWLGPVNSHKSIRSSAEIRGDTSAFRSSNLMESLDFKRKENNIRGRRIRDAKFF